MGSASKQDLVKVAPDYTYTFNENNYLDQKKEMYKHNDYLIMYPAIENRRIVNPNTQKKIKM